MAKAKNTDVSANQTKQILSPQRCNQRRDQKCNSLLIFASLLVVISMSAASLSGCGQVAANLPSVGTDDSAAPTKVLVESISSEYKTSLVEEGWTEASAEALSLASATAALTSASSSTQSKGIFSKAWAYLTSSSGHDTVLLAFSDGGGSTLIETSVSADLKKAGLKALLNTLASYSLKTEIDLDDDGRLETIALISKSVESRLTSAGVDSTALVEISSQILRSASGALLSKYPTHALRETATAQLLQGSITALQELGIINSDLATGLESLVNNTLQGAIQQGTLIIAEPKALVEAISSHAVQGFLAATATADATLTNQAASRVTSGAALALAASTSVTTTKRAESLSGLTAGLVTSLEGKNETIVKGVIESVVTQLVTSVPSVGFADSEIDSAIKEAVTGLVQNLDKVDLDSNTNLLDVGTRISTKLNEGLASSTALTSTAKIEAISGSAQGLISGLSTLSPSSSTRESIITSIVKETVEKIPSVVSSSSLQITATESLTKGIVASVAQAGWNTSSGITATATAIGTGLSTGISASTTAMTDAQKQSILVGAAQGAVATAATMAPTSPAAQETFVQNTVTKILEAANSSAVGITSSEKAVVFSEITAKATQAVATAAPSDSTQASTLVVAVATGARESLATSTLSASANIELLQAISQGVVKNVDNAGVQAATIGTTVKSVVTELLTSLTSAGVDAAHFAAAVESVSSGATQSLTGVTTLSSAQVASTVNSIAEGSTTAIAASSVSTAQKEEALQSVVSGTFSGLGTGAVSTAQLSSTAQQVVTTVIGQISNLGWSGSSSVAIATGVIRQANQSVQTLPVPDATTINDVVGAISTGANASLPQLGLSSSEKIDMVKTLAQNAVETLASAGVTAAELPTALQNVVANTVKSLGPLNLSSSEAASAVEQITTSVMSATPTLAPTTTAERVSLVAAIGTGVSLGLSQSTLSEATKTESLASAATAVIASLNEAGTPTSALSAVTNKAIESLVTGVATSGVSAAQSASTIESVVSHAVAAVSSSGVSAEADKAPLIQQITTGASSAVAQSSLSDANKISALESVASGAVASVDNAGITTSVNTVIGTIVTSVTQAIPSASLSSSSVTVAVGKVAEGAVSSIDQAGVSGNTAIQSAIQTVTNSSIASLASTSLSETAVTAAIPQVTASVVSALPDSGLSSAGVETAVAAVVQESIEAAGAIKTAKSIDNTEITSIATAIGTAADTSVTNLSTTQATYVPPSSVTQIQTTAQTQTTTSTAVVTDTTAPTLTASFSGGTVSGSAIAGLTVYHGYFTDLDFSTVATDSAGHLEGIAVQTAPAKGTLICSASSLSCRYTSTGTVAYASSDSFVIKISDVAGNLSPAVTVTLAVTAKDSRTCTPTHSSASGTQYRNTPGVDDWTACSGFTCSTGYEVTQDQCVQTGYTLTYSSWGSCSATAACSGSGTQTRSVATCRKLSDNTLVANYFCAGLASLSQACASPAGTQEVAISHGTQTQSCSAGATSGTPTSVVCASGYTEGASYTCTPVSCSSLSIANGSVTPSSGSVYTDTATYSCDTGYRVVGTATRTCQAAGTWSGSAPTCTEVSRSLSLASGAASINSVNITTTVSSDFTHQMAFFENNNCSGTATWVTYAASSSHNFGSASDGTLTLSAKFRDASLHESFCATDTITLDRVAPTVALSTSQANPFNDAVFTVSASTSESTTDLTLADITVTNGVATGVTGSGTSYSITVTPLMQGNVTVEIASGTFHDGAGNANTAAASITRSYDSIGPIPSGITLAANGTYKIGDDLDFTVSFDENANVTGTPLLSLTFGGTTKYATYQTGTGTNSLLFRYTVEENLPSAALTLAGTIGLPSGATLKDATTNNASLSFTASSTAGIVVDSVRPTVTLSGPAKTYDVANVAVTFSEAVTGFTSGDLTLTNATLVSLTGSGANYVVNLAATSAGIIGLDLQASSVTDIAGNTGTTTTQSWTSTYEVPLWEAQAYLKAPNAEASDQFGIVAAIDDDTAVVGTTGEDSNQTTITNGTTASSDNSATTSGAVYVFKRTGSTWAQEAYLKAPNAETNDSFGIKVAISQNTIVVGASAEDSNQTTITNSTTASSDNSASNAGAAYVFKRTGTTWAQEAYLKAPNTEASDSFGTAIAIHQDTVVIGATGEDSNQTTITNGTIASSDNSASGSGAAYVFKRTGTTWTQEAYLKAPNAEAGDTFGTAIAIHQDTVIVGATGEDSNQTTITNGTTASSDNSTSSSGAVYVFKRTGSNWAPEAYLKAPNTEASDTFGTAIAIHQDTVIVGATGEDSNQTTITNGTTASSDNSASSSGAVYVFKRTGSNWAAEAYLKAPNAATSDLFGASISVNNDRVIVGAASEDSNQTTITNGATASSDNSASASGAAYVFKRTGTTWVQEAYLKAPNAEANDQFSKAVFISGDTVIITAPLEDSNQTTITNGTTASSDNSTISAGAAYIYHLNTPFAVLTRTSGAFGTTLSATDDMSLGLTIGGNGITAYKYKIGLSGSTDCASPVGYSVSTAISTPLTYDLSTFAENSSITLCVIGITADGAEQRYANASSHTWALKDTTAPTSPSNLTVGVTYLFDMKNSPTLTWSAGSDTNLLGYEIAIGTSAGATNAQGWTFVGNTTSTQLTNLSLNIDTTYYATVRTVDRAGNHSTAVNSASGWTTTCTGSQWCQQAYLKSPVTVANDNFGEHVAIHGETIVVSRSGDRSNQTTITNGATAPSDTSASSSGAVHVYKRTGSAWAQEAYLKASNAEANDYFGSAVGIYGDTIVVGAFAEDSNQTTITNGTTASSDNSASGSGAVYVFKHTGTTWAQEAYLKAPNTGASDQFGYSAAIYGDTIVIGARLESSNQTTITNGTTASSDNSASSAGAAYVFKRTGSTWAQEAYLKAPNAEASDNFGENLAIYGDTIVVGVSFEDSNQTTITNSTTASSDNSASSAGAVYVFKRVGTTWAQEAYLKAPNAGAADYFGSSVAIHGDTIVTGGYGEASNQTTITNGTTASSDNSANGAGAAYVFKRTGTTWAQEAYLKASNAETNDYFGSAVGIYGDTVIVGARLESSNQTTITNGSTVSSNNSLSSAGAAYIFKRTGTTWAQTAYLKAPNAGSSDNFGVSIGISGDMIVVGANLEDSNQTTVTNGTTASSDNSVSDTGAAYVFNFGQSQAILSSNTGYPSTVIGTGVNNLDLTIGGNRISHYRYKIGLESSTDCSSSSGYSSDIAVSTHITYDLSSLADGGPYILCVVGVDVDGDVQPLSQATTHRWVVKDTTVPTPPSSLTENISHLYDTVRSPVLSWSASSASDLLGYEIAIGTTPGATNAQNWTYVGNTTSAQLTGLNLNLETNYYATIRAIDQVGNKSTAVNSSGWATTCAQDTWCNQAYIKASNTDTGDLFGTALAISGNTMAVGAYAEGSNQTTITNGATSSSDNSATNSGAVYVYQRTGSTWTQEAYLKAPNAEAGDYFGQSIAIYGDTIVVGATREDSNQTTITNGTTASSDNSATDSGAAYVFKRTGTTWAQEAYLKAPNAEASDKFASAVGIHQDTIVVGANAEGSNQTTITNGTTASSDNSAGSSGAAYVFRRTGSTWTQEAYLKAPNTNAVDIFGSSVAIHGDTIVVGAYYEDSNQTTITNGATASSDNSATDSGAAYVFKRTGSTWAQEAYLKAPNTEAGDYFGQSIAIYGDTIAVGARGEDSNQTTITNGTTASSDNSATDSGTAYVFKRTGSTWAQEAYLKAPNAEANDQFGDSIAIYGDTIAVGTRLEDSNQTTITNGTSASSDNSASSAGAVYVFKRTGSTWAQDAYLKAPNAEANDHFGYSVAINNDTAIVGSYLERSNQTTITNGTTASSNNSASSSGAAYVFTVPRATTPTQVTGAKLIYNPVGGEAVQIAIEYSDNDSSWTTASTTTVDAANANTYYPTWSPVGSHRYWRMSLSDPSDSCISGSVEVGEVNLLLLSDTAIDLAAKTSTSSGFTSASSATDSNNATAAVVNACTALIKWDLGN